MGGEYRGNTLGLPAGERSRNGFRLLVSEKLRSVQGSLMQQAELNARKHARYSAPWEGRGLSEGPVVCGVSGGGWNPSPRVVPPLDPAPSSRSPCPPITGAVGESGEVAEGVWGDQRPASCLGSLDASIPPPSLGPVAGAFSNENTNYLISG